MDKALACFVSLRPESSLQHLDKAWRCGGSHAAWEEETGVGWGAGDLNAWSSKNFLNYAVSLAQWFSGLQPP